MDENVSAVTTGAMDEDSKEFVTITHEMRVRARDIDGEAVHHWQAGHRHLVGLGLAMKELAESKLYLAIGFRSFEAYTQDHFGRGRHWAYERIAIAEKLQAVGVDPVCTCRQFPTHSQLRAALSLDDADFGALIAGTLALSSGETKPLAAMTVKQTEEVVRWKKQAEEADARAAKAEADLTALREQKPTMTASAFQSTVTDYKREKATRKQLEEEVRELKSRPPEQVPVPDPAKDAEIQRLSQALADRDRTAERERAERQKAERELKALQEKANRKATIDEEIRQGEQQRQQVRAQVLAEGAPLDEGQRDPEGDVKLRAAIQPIQDVIFKAIGDVRILKQTGVGGPEKNKDAEFKEFSARLKQLAAMIDSIVMDRATRAINVVGTEVQ